MDIYEKRAVAFIDILGFRDLVRRGRESEILSTMNSIPKKISFFAEGDLADLDFKVSSFSDSVVASARFIAKNHVPAVVVALYAGELSLALMQKGILTRGAIAVGMLHHQDPNIFGPALIDAYELESNVAQYPRIIVPQKIASGICQTLFGNFGWDWFVKNHPFRVDFDGLNHLDVLGPFFTSVRPPSLKPKVNGGDINSLGRVTTSMVMKLCRKKQRDYRVTVKYEWLQSYLLDCCARFSWKIPTKVSVHNSRSTTACGFRKAGA